MSNHVNNPFATSNAANHTNNNHNGARSQQTQHFDQRSPTHHHQPPPSRLLQSMENLGLLLRVLLFPLRFLLCWLFPSRGIESEGLSAASNAKAAEQFVAFLRCSATTPGTGNIVSDAAIKSLAIADAWCSVGFAAARQETFHKQGLMLVFLHAPLHSQSHRFCQVVLQHDRVVTWLRQQQQQSQLVAFGVSIHTAQGSYLQQLLQVSAFPFMAILQPRSSSGRPSSTSSSTMNFLLRIEGSYLLQLRPDQLLQYLQAVLQQHQQHVYEQETRRLLREEESQLRQQQDEEYQAALRADQERERQAAEEREAELRKQEEDVVSELARLQAEADSLDQSRAMVKPEPASGGTMVRFLLPSGAKVNRRFGSDETFRALKSFLYVYFHENNIDLKHVGLSTSYPRKSYNDDDQQTLEDAGLSPTAVLIVQDLDA